MRRKEWMRVVAALAAFAVLGTGSAVTAAAEETGTVVSETDSTADKTVFTGSCGEDATWTYDKSSETLTIMGTGSVEAYVKAGVMIKTPGWQVVNDYAAKHIVIGDGITEVGEGFLDTCIYGTTEPRTLQVSSTVTKMDLNPALQERSVTFYGTKGSWFYEQVYETNRFVDISTGEPDKVPTSGTYSDGASWNYDEKSETLTVSGDGGITEKEFTTYFGWDRPVKRIVIGKEVKLPDWNSDVSGLNLFFRALISDAETGNGPFLSIYPDSEAGKAYEDLVAYRVSKGSTEEEVRSGLEEVVAFLDANIAYTGACGAEGSEITWSLDPNTNTLTFSGTGTIRTYDGPNAKFENPAWNDCNVSINHIVVGEGITDIGSFTDDMFYYNSDSGCAWQDRTIEIPDSVESWEHLSPNFLYETKYGTAFYYRNASQKSIRLSCSSVTDNPVYLVEGTSALGGSWRFDYESSTLTISGPGFVEYKDIEMYPFTKVVIDSSVTIGSTYQDQDFSTALLMWFQRLNTISDTEPGRLEISVLYDENSDFQQEFAKLPESVRSEAQRVSALHSVAVGDVNQDGRLDVTDAVLLSKAVNGSVTVSDAQRETMDCDGDGDITANDVTTLMRFLVHLETELPPKQ